MKSYYLVATDSGEWNNKYGVRTMKTSLYEINTGVSDLTKVTRIIRYKIAEILTVFDTERKGHRHIETHVYESSELKDNKIPEDVAIGYKVIAKDRHEAIEKFLDEKWIKINHVKEWLIADELENSYSAKKKRKNKIQYIDDAAPALSKTQVKKKYKNKVIYPLSENREGMKMYTIASINDWSGVIIPKNMHGLFSKVHNDMGGYFCGFYSYRHFKNSTMLAYRIKKEDEQLEYKVLEKPVQSTFSIDFYNEATIYAPDDETAIALFINGKYTIN